METNKSIIVLYITLIIGGLFTSCTHDDLIVEILDPKVITEPELVEGEYTEWSLSAKGDTLRLYSGVMDSLAVHPLFVWYEIKNGNDTIKLDVINNYLDIPEFKEYGIKEYVCKVSFLDNDSVEVSERAYPFHVAFTGLPLVSIITNNNQPVLSKTEKILGTMKLTTPSGGGQLF